MKEIKDMTFEEATIVFDFMNPYVWLLIEHSSKLIEKEDDFSKELSTLFLKEINDVLKVMNDLNRRREEIQIQRIINRRNG